MLQILPEFSDPSGSKNGSKLKFVNIICSQRPDEPVTLELKLPFTNAVIRYPMDFFKTLNAIWASYDNHKQLRIFEAYEVFADYANNASLNSINSKHKVNAVVRTIVEEHNYEEVKEVLTRHGEVYIPTSVKDFIPVEHRGQPKDKTYIKDDYRKLGEFIHYFRFMAPIISQLIKSYYHLGKDESDREVLRIINRTEISKNPEFQRLRAYVESLFEDRVHDINQGLFLSGLSREDIPDIVFSRLINRVITALEPNAPEIELVASISNKAGKRLVEISRGYNGVEVRQKTLPVSADNSEAKPSRQEMWKLPEDMTNHTRAVYLSSSKRFGVDLANVVKPAHLEEEFRRYDETIRHMLTRKPDTLDNSVFRSAGIGLLSKLGHSHRLRGSCTLDVRRVQLAVTTVLMNYLGFPKLALYINARCVPIPSDTLKPNLVNESVTKLLPPEQQEEIDKMYPISRPVLKDKKVNRQQNFLVEEVNRVVLELTKHDLYIDGPNWLIEAHGFKRGEAVEINSELKLQLVNFAICVYNLELLNDEDELLYKEFPELRPI